MKKNLYYRMITWHKNFVRMIVFAIVKVVAHYPGILIDVFLRRNFGERYYTFATPLTVFIALCVIFYLDNSLYGQSFFNGFWLAFAIVFLIVAIYRRIWHIKGGQTFNFELYSYYSGDTSPLWKKLEGKVSFMKMNLANIEKYYEPGLFFLVGLILLLFPFSRSTGLLLALVGFLQFARMHVNYAEGRHFILDKIDEMIANKELFHSFVEGKGPGETKGFRFLGPKPDSMQLREEICEKMFEGEEVYDVR